MGDRTKISWADATLNPAYGCSKVSPACANCYALRDAKRFSQNPMVADKFVGLVDSLTGEWTGRVNLFPERMEQALRWRKPRRIFVGSMTDIFHENVPDSFLDRIFAVMALARRHTFLLLTKRPKKMREYMNRFVDDACWPQTGCPIDGPLPNVWLGTTVENQAMAETRIPILLGTPAAKRFVSVEPMLGPVNLEALDYPEAYDAEVGLLDSLRGLTCDDSPTHPALDWVICGGETGPRARIISKEWVFSLRDQCASAGVPFFFKNWGKYRGPGDWEIPAGRLVEGVEHNGIPEVHHA